MVPSQCSPGLEERNKSNYKTVRDIKKTRERERERERETQREREGGRQREREGEREREGAAGTREKEVVGICFDTLCFLFIAESALCVRNVCNVCLCVYLEYQPIFKHEGEFSSSKQSDRNVVPLLRNSTLGKLTIVHEVFC